MTGSSPDHDLSVSRIIKAPRAAVWNAWADPRSFEQWWIPAPMVMKVVEMDLRPGGGFVTRMSEDGATFTPHVDGCFLAIEPQARIVFTTALLGGWRPAGETFITMTAEMTFRDHPDGVEYVARAMHSTRAERDRHEEMGFHDGWGTVSDQLKALVEA